jgi:O-antigen ligase
MKSLAQNIYYYSKQRKNISSGLFILNLTLLIVIFLTYRSFNKLFYLNWIAGFAIFFIYILYLLITIEIEKYILRTVVICSLWLVYALFITLTISVNPYNHIQTLIISTFYTLSSIALSSFILNNKNWFKKIVMPLSIVWTMVNGCLLFLFIIGKYITTKGSFSGVFHDRNVFCITTLLILAFILGYIQAKKDNKKMLYLLVVINVSMILVSSSITGFIGLFVLFFMHYKTKFTKISFKHIFVILLLFAFLFGMLFINNPIKRRADRFLLSISGNTASLNENESAFLRLYLYQNGLLLAKENWLFGVGLNNARYYIIWPGRDVGSFLHNTYLDIITSGGIILFLLYYLPIIYTFFYLHKKYKMQYDENRHLCITAYYLIIIKLLVDMTWTTYFEFGIVFTTIFSICVMLKIRENKRTT